MLPQKDHITIRNSEQTQQNIEDLGSLEEILREFHKGSLKGSVAAAFWHYKWALPPSIYRGRVLLLFLLILLLSVFFCLFLLIFFFVETHVSPSDERSIIKTGHKAEKTGLDLLQFLQLTLNTAAVTLNPKPPPSPA